MARMGRPTKLTASLIEQLDAAIMDCLTLHDACDFLGIAYMTFRRWVRAGTAALRAEIRGEKLDDERGLLADFCYSVNRSLAKLKRDLLAAIKSRSEGWQAAAWIMERRWPQVWGRFSREMKEMRKVVTQLVKAMNDHGIPLPAEVG